MITARIHQIADVLQGGAPPVISWFIVPITIDITPINPSYSTYKPTELTMGHHLVCFSHGFSPGFPQVQAKFGHLSPGGGRLPQHQAPRAAPAAHRQLAGVLGRTQGIHFKEGAMGVSINAGWWFGCHQFYFPRNIGNLIIPTDFHMFQRGGPTTKQNGLLVLNAGHGWECHYNNNWLVVWNINFIFPWLLGF